jgi:hypothetical protein
MAFRFVCSLSHHLVIRHSAWNDSHSMPGLALYRYLFTPGGSSRYSSDGHVWRCEHVNPTECTNGIPRDLLQPTSLDRLQWKDIFKSFEASYYKSFNESMLCIQIWSSFALEYCHFLSGFTTHLKKLLIHTVQWTFEYIGNAVDTTQHCWTYKSHNPIRGIEGELAHHSKSGVTPKYPRYESPVPIVIIQRNKFTWDLVVVSTYLYDCPCFEVNELFLSRHLHWNCCQTIPNTQSWDLWNWN